jgi:type I restriction enzyme S subunit
MNNQSILVENVPIDWVIKKIKYVFDERKETNDPIQTDVLVSLTHDRGVILHSEKGDIGNKEKDDIKKYKIVHPGDIVVNSMNVIIGSSGLSDHFGLVSPVYYMLVKKDSNHDNKFFHYLFRSIVFQKSLIGVGNGILEHRMRVPIDKLGGHLIPLPSANEQKLISRYLDKKTSQIDSLVEKIRKKIELLKEQRTSLINHYVTKGLDPNVEMKDSGVEWIGEIPKHWIMTKVKWVSEKIGSGVTPKGGSEVYSEEGIPFLRSQNIHFDGLHLSDVVYISEEIDDSMSGSRVQINDVLYNITGGSIGRCCLVTNSEPMNVNQHVCIVRPLKKVVPSYLLSILASEFGQRQLRSNLTGSGREGLNFENLGNFLIPMMNYHEQKAIGLKITNLTQKSHILEQKLFTKIQKLVEYRQSLISSVVTGKVRVTEDLI